MGAGQVIRIDNFVGLTDKAKLQVRVHQVEQAYRGQ
jgi:hypothetical protein